jgi:hypothetical protein
VAGWLQYESSALRWRQGCSCFSLLIRPCRCIKPNAQASRDPLTIRRLPHLQTTHSFRDRTLHYLQPPLVPDCSPQTATRWHSSLTALKNPRPRLLSALSALQVALLSCKVLESPSSRQAGFRRQNPVSIPLRDLLELMRIVCTRKRALRIDSTLQTRAKTRLLTPSQSPVQRLSVGLQKQREDRRGQD